MAMSHRDRFKLKSQIVAELGSNWSWEQTSLLFGELGIDYGGDGFDPPGVVDIVALVSDGTLVEIYSIVFNVEKSEVAGVVEEAEVFGQWKPGLTRVFLSHSAVHKQFVGEVADELAVIGIHGFVAHDTMEYSKPWQQQIEAALRSMQAFVALTHGEFNDSAWCHQEVGWALGRRVPRYVVRLGSDPAGFIARDQWPSAASENPKQVAHRIYSWVATLPELGPSIIDGLFESLRTAVDYVSAGAAAERIVKLETLSVADFDRLDAIYWENNQIYGGALATNQLKPFYMGAGRPWPPPRPDPTF